MEETKSEVKLDTEAVRRNIEHSINHYRSTVKNFEAKLGPGQRRRRSAYDHLEENGLLTVDFIYNEYPRILNKQSTLSASLRSAIRAIGDEALALYFGERRRKEEEAKKQQQTK